MKAIIVVIFLIAFALILQSCAGDQADVEKSDAKGIRMTPKNIAEIENIEWALNKMVQDEQDVALVKDSNITFSYRGESKVAGQATINRYFGNFEMNDKGDINWEKTKFGMTMMAGPPELMDQEKAYMETLPKTDSMYRLGSVLFLENTDGSNLLQFIRK
jgi:heat shock protein HslJ